MDLSNPEGFYYTPPPKDIDFMSLPLSAFYGGLKLDHVYDPDGKLQPEPHAKRADHPPDFKKFSFACWFPSRIATFPTRLLGEIFWYILYDVDGTPVKDIEVERTTLRSICQHWMNAIDSNSFLWRALVLEPFDLWYRDYRVPVNLVERFVRCSGDEPISISIRASLERYPHYAQAYADLVIREIIMNLVGPQGDVLKRWASFKFSCCDLFDASLLGPLGLWPAPLLTVLEIHHPGRFGGVIELNAPMLRRLVHHKCSLFFSPRRDFHFIHLTFLVLSTPSALDNGVIVNHYGWLNLLRQAPRLISLRLHTIVFPEDDFFPGPFVKEAIVELSHLQQIIINEDGPWKFLQYLRLPALTTMRIEGAFSDTLCNRLLGHAQCYDHLSHIKNLWFQRSLTTASLLTIEEGGSFYGGFLARLFPDLHSLIVPYSIYGYSAQEAMPLMKVWPRDDAWRGMVLARIWGDTRFPNRAVVNGGETVFKEHFECLHDVPGDLEAYRILSLKERRS